MKRIVIGIVMSICLMVPAVYADESSSNINFFMGQKKLDSDDWALGYDDQFEIGIMYDYRAPYWPVSIAVDLFGSVKEETFSGVDVTGSTTELCLGIKKIWEAPGMIVKPFVGAGVAAVYAKIEAVDPYYNRSYSEEASGFGYYISGGAYVTLGESLNLGVLLRYSQAEVSIDDPYAKYDLEAGGTHVGIFIGYHW